MVTVAGGGCKGVCCGERVSVLMRLGLQMGSGCHMPAEMDIEFLVLCFVAGFFSGCFFGLFLGAFTSDLVGHLHCVSTEFWWGLMFHWKLIQDRYEILVSILLSYWFGCCGVFLETFCSRRMQRRVWYVNFAGMILWQSSSVMKGVDIWSRWPTTGSTPAKQCICQLERKLYTTWNDTVYLHDVHVGLGPRLMQSFYSSVYSACMIQWDETDLLSVCLHFAWEQNLPWMNKATTAGIVRAMELKLMTYKPVWVASFHVLLIIPKCFPIVLVQERNGILSWNVFYINSLSFSVSFALQSIQLHHIKGFFLK